MGWSYQFLTLTPEEVQTRREALDYWAFLAHLAGFVPALLVLGTRLARRYFFDADGSGMSAVGRGQYDAVPNSPALKSYRRSFSGTWEGKLRSLSWWLGDDVWVAGARWGQREQWLFSTGRLAWMLLFCVLGTGNDYLHLTKRFGIVAVSQLPLQYLLALKSFSPISWALGSSHEALNRWHRAHARVISVLLTLHAVFYFNYFIQVGILARRLFAPVVFAGFVAFLSWTLMNATAMTVVRRWSYRLFFVTHLGLSFFIPALVFIHAKSARFYVLEALLFFVIDLAARRLRTVAAQASLETIPGTNLIKIAATVPQHRINLFRDQPAAHIYLSIPAAARPPASGDSLLFEFLFNPFTVAAVDEQTCQLTLVARHLDGPLTRRLAEFAQQPSTRPMSSSFASEAKIPLSIEGPYGVVARSFYNQLASPSIDRVLLIAGGVGATFAVPIYRALKADNSSTKVNLVWAVRSAGDATWAVSPSPSPPSRSGTNNNAAKSVLEDPDVEIFLTGDIVNGPRRASVTSSADAEVEMNSLYRDRRRGGRATASHNRKRPDLRRFVDDVFGHGLEEKVAVLVCGPEEMAREVRGVVGEWVRRGREVYWHDESFGW